MGITTQILNRFLRIFKGWLTVNHPVLVVEFSEQMLKGLFVGKVGDRARENSISPER